MASCKSALNPPVVYSIDHSKAVVLVLLLLFLVLWFILRGDLFFGLTLCYFVLGFFSPFSIAITSLGEKRTNLSAFRTFVRFVLCFDFSVSSSSWCLERATFCDCGTSWTFLLPYLTICLWPCPPWFSYWFSFTLAYSTISHAYSYLCIIVINLICLFASMH